MEELENMNYNEELDQILLRYEEAAKELNFFYYYTISNI